MNDSSRFIQRIYRKYYVTTFVTLLLKTSIQFIGAFLAGNMLGAVSLGAIGLLFPFIGTYAAVGALFEIGSSILCAHYIAENDFVGAKKVVTASYVSNLIICVLLIIFGFLFMDNILNWLNVPVEVFGEARLFAGFCLLTGFFSSSNDMSIGLLRFDGKITEITAVTALLPICSFCITYALIRYFGFGLSAVAIGSNSGLVLTGCIFTYMIAAKTKVLGFAKIKASELVSIFAKIVKNGMISALSNIFYIAGIIIINGIVITTYGQSALAVFSVFLSLEDLLVAASSGSSIAFIPLVGVMNAERDCTSVKQLLKISLIYGFVVVSVVNAVLILFPSQIAGAFGLVSDEAIALMYPLLIALVVYNVVQVLLNTIIYLHNTLERNSFSMILTFCENFVYLIICVLVLSKMFGVVGVWYSFWAGTTLTIITAVIYGLVKSGRNKYLTPLFLIDTEPERKGTFVSFSANNSIDDIMDCSRKISEFCSRNNLDKSRSNLIALTIEEMLLLIRERSMVDNSDVVNVRIMLHQDDVIMRIRNGGAEFNPLSFYKNMKLDETLSLGNALQNEQFLGLKMVVDMVKRTEYCRTFDVNNLTVVI